MTEKNASWAGPQDETTAQPHGHALQPHLPHGAGGPFRPPPAPPLVAPGALVPLRAQYALSPRFQHFAGALDQDAARPAPPQVGISPRGGTLPPNAMARQDVLASSGIVPRSVLPFVPASMAERVAPGGTPFTPALPELDPLNATGTHPPVPPAPASTPHAASAPTPIGPLPDGVMRLPRTGTLPPGLMPPMMHPAAPAPLQPTPVSAALPEGPPAAADASLHAGVAREDAAPSAESPWASTSARFEVPVLPSALALDREPPARPPGVQAPPSPRSSSRTPVLVLSVILAVALLALAAITVWQSIGGRDPISIGYTEPPSTEEGAPTPTASADVPLAAPSSAPRPMPRPKPKTEDIYDEADKERDRH